MIRFRIRELVLFVYISTLFLLYGSLRPIVEIISITILVLLSVKKEKEKIDRYYYYWGGLFALISLMSIVWSKDIVASLYGARGVLESVLCGFVVLRIVSTKEDIFFVQKSIIILAILLILKIFLTVSFSDILSRRFGYSLNANAIGIRFAFCTVFVLWQLKNRFISLGWGSILMMLFGGMAILSGSKKSLLIIGIGVCGIVILCSKNMRNTFWGIILIGLFLNISWYVIQNVEFFYNIIGARVLGFVSLLTKGTQYGDASSRERIRLIEIAIDYWKNKKILGYGINTFGTIVRYSSYGSSNLYSHCNYTELLFGVGLIGTIIYYLVYIYLLVVSLSNRVKNSFSSFVTTFCVIMIVIDIGMVSYSDEFIQFFVMLCFAILGVRKNDKNNEESTSCNSKT